MKPSVALPPSVPGSHPFGCVDSGTLRCGRPSARRELVMGRSVLHWVCVFVLVALPVVGCSEESTAAGGSGGSGGTGGIGATGGFGGTGGMPECESPEDCDDGNECRADLCTDGACEVTPVDDGTACTEGECHQGVCTPIFPCTEQGIRDAIAEGGGPHFFACDGPTTVVTEAEIVIDNDVILDGEGELTVDGNAGHRVWQVAVGITAELRGVGVTSGASASNGGGIRNDGTLTVTNSTVSGNTAESFGGGIWNNGMLSTLTITDSTVSGNTASSGGGIYNDGRLTMTDSTVSGNTVTDFGGGIRNVGTMTVTDSTVSGNRTDDAGGGILNDGTLTVTNSTVSGNTAEFDGGGILNAAIMTVTNSTVSGNTAVFGGGIRNGDTLTVTNSTVSGNTADNAGGGILNDDTLTVTNTLIDGDCSGAIASGGYNIESPGDTCGFDEPTDQVSVAAEDLKLGPLADNGGPTETHALLPGSVAIDVIPETMCVDADGEPLTTDQRGEPRPGGSMCDVGSFEEQP